MNDPIGYRREVAGSQPPFLFPGYGSTVKRAPSAAPLRIPHTLSEVTGPLTGLEVPANADLTKQHKAAPLGERIVVSGRVLDEDGRPVANTVVELWQCNAAGRYLHALDQHDAPLDPNFSGAGQCVTDEKGEYRFLTVKPGAYPWRNHHNGWRPAHIHFSLFGPSFVTRLVTQMYWPGDPLLDLDPIFNSIPDPAGRQSMVCAFDLETTVPEFALGWRWDIVLRGRNATAMES